MARRPLRCPDPSCRRKGRGPGRSPTRHAHLKTRRGRFRRYQCPACGKTFTATTGTVYHRLRSSPEQFDMALRMAVEGQSKAAIARTLGKSVGTIRRWIERAARIAADFNDRKLRGIDAVELQTDEIRSSCGSRHRPLYVYTSLEVWSRLWVSVLVGRRNWRNTRLHMNDLRSRVAPSSIPTLLVTDSYGYYANAVKKAFGNSIVYVQVDRTYRKGRVTSTKTRLVIGPEHRLEAARSRSEDSKKINISYVDRLHLLLRRALACLQRKTTAGLREAASVLDLLELMRCHYNFLRPHSSLKFGRERRTPAQQAGLVSRRLSFRDVLVSCMPTDSAGQGRPGWRERAVWTRIRAREA